MKITNDVRTDQRLLNLAGYGAGPVDGVVGRLTRAAYERWAEDVAAVWMETPLPDERSARNLTGLLPDVQRRARVWLARAAAVAKAQGLVVKIICGTRSWADQDALYAQGRTAKGPRVTNARGGSSWHNYGVAFDIGLFTEDGGYVTDDAVYQRLVKAAGVPEGFEWGGNWKSFPDVPHFQYNVKYQCLAALQAGSVG